MPERVAEAEGELKQRAMLALTQAALAISSDLSLESTLQKIVDSARELVEAKYAAIGNFDSEGRLNTFVTSGIPGQLASKIAHRPEGRGLLGEVLQSQQAIRVSDIETDPRSVGFPPEHPAMTSFLGVPIRAGDATLGNLYLTDRLDGKAFSESDEALIKILANHAAAAIRNAQLFEATQEYSYSLEARNRELSAINAVARVTSDYADLIQVLEETLDEVLTVTGMDAAEVFLKDEGSEDLVLTAHRGDSPESFHTVERFKMGEGLPGRAAAEGRTLIVSDLPREARFVRKAVIDSGFRTFASVPIRVKHEVVGAMDLASRDERTFDTGDISLLEAIGHQVGVAVENARLYEEIGRLAIIEERSRIGMDLHDGVIQSIYAVGLTLETARLLLHNNEGQAEQMLDQAVDGLNDAIRDIRNFILDLRPYRFEGDLLQGMARLMREFRANVMVEVEMTAPEDVMTRISPQAARAFFMTTQEALANIARHARAKGVVIELSNHEDGVRLEVSDDGEGFDLKEQAQAVGHGLANMQARAEDLGGEFHVQSQPGKGTKVTLTLPPSRTS